MRASLLAMLLVLLSWPAMAVDGTNLPGHDYTHFPAPSVTVCRNSCGGDSRCQAYTWVKPGIQGPSGQCWLKDAVPTIVKDPCCDSFTRELITKRDMQPEIRVNRPGSDFNSFDVAQWQICAQACDQSRPCASWTYVQPGVQGKSARCWLKSKVALPSVDPNTISGVKFVSRSQRFD
jgi:hypothetical protein